MIIVLLVLLALAVALVGSAGYMQGVKDFLFHATLAVVLGLALAYSTVATLQG